MVYVIDIYLKENPLASPEGSTFYMSICGYEPGHRDIGQSFRVFFFKLMYC